MPKLIDYPRTSYTGAWELSEIVDDTGGKCAIETAARKLNRKVSGSFKAIIGSAVKFGLITSKRDLLTTTTLFKRIKHAYDKQEELIFHREAFLTPLLFTQICRKFRSRELPIQMLDVMLIREFGVEEINAQTVAKAFVDGCRMVGLLDERNIIADIDTLSSQLPPRRELSSPPPAPNMFRNEQAAALDNHPAMEEEDNLFAPASPPAMEDIMPPIAAPMRKGPDAIASLFGFDQIEAPEKTVVNENYIPPKQVIEPVIPQQLIVTQPTVAPPSPNAPLIANALVPTQNYQIQVSGPGVNTVLSITEEEDIALAIALLEKIRRQLTK